MVLDFPSTHLPMSSSANQLSSARSSSSGGSYYPVPSSPIPFRHGPGHGPGWCSANPIPISTLPSPEAGSQNDQAELDWDPRAEVPTEAGEVVHGRLVSSLLFF